MPLAGQEAHRAGVWGPICDPSIAAGIMSYSCISATPSSSSCWLWCFSGPKKLPEIGRTIGKLLAEFRRASNEFKFQIQEELRNMEDEERRKKLAEQQALKTAEALPATTARTPPRPPSCPHRRARR